MRTTASAPRFAASSVDQRSGVTAALIAYVMWGLMPIYFTATASIPALQVLSHRVIWAVPFGMLILSFRRQWPEVRRLFGQPRVLARLAITTVFITINWLVYIWAVQNGRIFDASLGYYINPLLYVLVGALFLGERLSSLQVIAATFAAIGVGVLVVQGGTVPWVALILAVSFTVYGVQRKKIAVGAMPGLFVETLFLLPIFTVYLAWLSATELNAFAWESPTIASLLMLAGPLTVLPLLFFAIGARRLRLATLGFLQFIGPTLQFLVAVFYGEKLTDAHLICMGFIWLAVLVFSADAFLEIRSS